jgi:hypothetical protein
MFKNYVYFSAYSPFNYDKEQICSNTHPTRCNDTQFILSGNCSTYFGWYYHPLSGEQKTLSTASGI